MSGGDYDGRDGKEHEGTHCFLTSGMSEAEGGERELGSESSVLYASGCHLGPRRSERERRLSVDNHVPVYE